MKEFQIQKVDSFVREDHLFASVSYYPNSDKSSIIGYYSETLVKIKIPFQVGFWRLKSVKPKDK